jgi:uncharacterized protein YndB with AHSA1/START domain
VQRPGGDTSPMAVVTTTTHVTPEEVFDLLLNGWRYAEWVVGTKRIRSVEDDWPAPGSRFHHVLGLGPVSLFDRTEVEEVDPPRHIVLLVRVWPAGRGRVTLDVGPAGGRTRIRMEEVPIEGPAKTVDGPVLEVLTHLRNREALRRLRRAVEEARVPDDGPEG